MSYLGTQYPTTRQPYTDYPLQLVTHLEEVAGLSKFRLGALLELGCGRGDFVKAWRLLGYVTNGVDREAVLEHVIQVDLAKDPIPMLSGSYGTVFSKSLIEHLSDPSNMLNEAKRVLKPGGTLIIMTPDWRTYMKTFYDDYTHVRPYDVVSLRDLLEAHGFKDVTSTRMYQYPALWYHPRLAWAATLWRWLTPVEFSLWLSKVTGIQFFRWASQLTILAIGRKDRM